MPKKLVWIGPRHSDIESIREHFWGEIVYVSGASEKMHESRSLQDALGVRINHNSHTNTDLIDSFIEKSAIDILSKTPEATFLWYRPPSSICHKDILKQSPFLPPLSIIPLINNKIKMRLMMTMHSAPIPITLLPKKDCTFKTLRSLFPNFSKFVVQAETGAGGFQTFLLCSDRDDKNVSTLDETALIASGYIESGIPVNVHIIVGSHDVLTFSPSVQIIEPGRNGRMLFSGSDFAATQYLRENSLEALKHSAHGIGKILSKLGYRGVAGIDFLIQDEVVFFVEINPRFQASTFLLNAMLLANGQKSIQELHMEAIQGEALTHIESSPVLSSYIIRHFDAPDGLFSTEGNYNLQSPDRWVTMINTEKLNYRVETDSISPSIAIESGGQKGRVVFEGSVVGFSYNSPPQILPSLECHFRQSIEKVWADDSIAGIASLKFNLLGLGAQVSMHAREHLFKNRSTLTIRDGIAGGLEIVFHNNVHVNVPIKERYALISPYIIDFIDEVGFVLYYNEKSFPIEIMPQPSFVGCKAQSGMPMEAIGQLFTDRLSLYPFRGCIFNRGHETGCSFCEVAELGEPKKTTLDDIRELVCYCRDNDEVNMRHILLSGGVPPVSQWDYYLKTIDCIRSETDVPIYQMIIPPANLSFLNELHSVGVDEIGFNMEIVSPTFAIRVMPGKGRIDREKYLRAMEYAVNLWGDDNGQVRSALIVGLEPLHYTLDGVKMLAERGVLPILSPFRPIPRTPLANYMPAKPDSMMEAWYRGSEIAEQHRQVLGPICIGCQNNTISIPTGSPYRYY